MALEIAVVGTGKVAQNYLTAIVQREDVALRYYNRTRAKAEATAAQFGGEVADSLAELLVDDPDCVLVLTAETARFQITEALLALRPRRLFFEKPLVAMQGQAAVTEDDFVKGHALLSQAQAANIPTAMVFNYRFFDQSPVGPPLDYRI